MFLYLCRELLHIDMAAFPVNRNLTAEDELIRSLEREGLNVILVFSYSVKDDDLGTSTAGLR